MTTQHTHIIWTLFHKIPYANSSIGTNLFVRQCQSEMARADSCYSRSASVSMRDDQTLQVNIGRPATKDDFIYNMSVPWFVNTQMCMFIIYNTFQRNLKKCNTNAHINNITVKTIAKLIMKLESCDMETAGNYKSFLSLVSWMDNWKSEKYGFHYAIPKAKTKMASLFLSHCNWAWIQQKHKQTPTA